MRSVPRRASSSPPSISSFRMSTRSNRATRIVIAPGDSGEPASQGPNCTCRDQSLPEDKVSDLLAVRVTGQRHYFGPTPRWNGVRCLRGCHEDRTWGSIRVACGHRAGRRRAPHKKGVSIKCHRIDAEGTEYEPAVAERFQYLIESGRTDISGVTQTDFHQHRGSFRNQHAASTQDSPFCTLNIDLSRSICRKSRVPSWVSSVLTRTRNVSISTRPKLCPFDWSSSPSGSGQRTLVKVLFSNGIRNRLLKTPDPRVAPVRGSEDRIVPFGWLERDDVRLRVLLK